MIPKTIHYCWFGRGNKSVLIERCIESWSANNPECNIVLWNEDNVEFDTPFLQNSLQKKHWAFISDYVRMRVLYRFGGIYLDTDMEVVKPLDPLFNNDCFVGFESKDRLNTGAFGCVKGHIFPQKCMHVMDENYGRGRPYQIAPEVATKVYQENLGVGIKTLSEEHFYPYNPYDKFRDKKYLMYADVTENTYAIHHWGKSWKMSLWDKLRRKLLT